MHDVLTGVTVLEFNRVAPASLTAMLLADLGARVVKVESLPQAEAFGSGVSPKDATDDQLWSNYLNRGKESLSADLKSAAGRRLASALCHASDVVVDGFRPGVLDRLGLGYEQTSAVNEGVIYCSMSGYGQTGPYRQFAGHDLNFLAASGVLQALPRENEPLPPLNLVADFGAASMFAFSGVLAALLGRGVTGRGRHLDLSYLECTLALAAGTSSFQRFATEGVEPEPHLGVFSGRFAYYRCYACSDGKLLSVACTEPGLWARLCAALRRPDLLAGGPAPGDLVGAPSEEQVRAIATLEELLLTRSRDDWFDSLCDMGVGVGKVNSLREVGTDPQLAHRKALWHGVDGRWQVAPVFGSESSSRRRAPRLGEHTRALLQEMDVEVAAASLADDFYGL